MADLSKSGAPVQSTPSWLTPPTGPASEALTTYTNPLTGEQYTAPTGGYTVNVSAPSKLPPYDPNTQDYLGNSILVGRNDPFFSSPEYQEFSSYGGPATLDMYDSPYFGSIGSGTVGSRQDEAYENYLRRLGRSNEILRQPPIPIEGGDNLAPPPGAGGLASVASSTPPSPVQNNLNPEPIPAVPNPAPSGGLATVSGPSQPGPTPPGTEPVNVAPLPTVGNLPAPTIEPILETQTAPLSTVGTTQTPSPVVTQPPLSNTQPALDAANAFPAALAATALPAAASSGGSKMSLTQGAPLPDIRTTETKTQAVPEYYTQYLQDLSGAGRTALGRTAAEGVAPMDVLQTQGYGMVPEAATAYRPGLASAGQTAAALTAGIDPTRISALMDPYQKQVVDEMARLQQQNIQRSVLPSLKGAFVGRGGLGSQRYAAATGQTLADMQSSLLGQQAGALSTGYQNALKAALDEARLREAATQTQARIAGQEQELGLLGAGAMTKAGAERQAYEQAIRDYPLKQATGVAGLMRGYQMPLSSTETFVGPKAGTYQQSPLANILGVLSTLGGIRPGSVTYDAQGRPIAGDSLLNIGYKALKKAFESGGSGVPTEGQLQADEAIDEAYWKNLFSSSESGANTNPNYDQYFEGSTLPFAQGGLASIKRG